MRGGTCVPPLGDNLYIYQPAVLIAGATIDFSETTDEMTERRWEQQLPGLPKHDLTAAMEEGVDACGVLKSGQAMGQGAVADGTFEGSSSESSDDDNDEDFLDLLVNTLDGDFDADLFI